MHDVTYITTTQYMVEVVLSNQDWKLECEKKEPHCLTKVRDHDGENTVEAWEYVCGAAFGHGWNWKNSWLEGERKYDFDGVFRPSRQAQERKWVEPLFFKEKTLKEEKMMKDSLRNYERGPARGETRKCMRSMDEMLNFTSPMLGLKVVLHKILNVKRSDKYVMMGRVSRLHGGMWPNRSHVTNKCFLLCWCSFVTQFQWLGFIKWTYLTSKRPRSIKLLFVIKTLLRGVVAILLLLKFGQAQDILKHVTGYTIMICHGPPWQIEKMLVGISNK